MLIKATFAKALLNDAAIKKYNTTLFQGKTFFLFFFNARPYRCYKLSQHSNFVSIKYKNK